MPFSPLLAASDGASLLPLRRDRLLSLTVQDGVHFKSLHLSFADSLNLLLGGRGTGKSGVLHLIRFALGARIPDAYADEHDDYVRNTLGDGSVKVEFANQYGAPYSVTRTYGSDPVFHSADGAVLPNVSLGSLFFSLDAYAQNEIETIAKNPKAQLALIDKFLPPEVAGIDEAVEQLDRKLAHTDDTLRRLAGEIADDAARESELPAIVEALKAIDAGASDAKGPVEERARAHEAKVARSREKATMTALTRELAGVREALDAVTRDSLGKLGRSVEADLERGAHGDVFRRVHAAVHTLAGTIEGAGGRLRAELAAAEARVSEEARALAVAHAKADDAYNALVVLDAADRERAAQRARLHKKFEDLSVVVKRLGDRRREEAAVRQERDALYTERTRLLAERSDHRKRAGEALSEGLKEEIRVTVTPGGDHTPFAQLLAEIFKGANIRPTSFIDTIAQRIPPSVLVAMAEANELEPLIEIDPAKSGKADRARKILEILRTSGRLPEIARVRLEDAPLIELKVGAKWRPSNRLSTGQRCACILPIVLLQSVTPLLIDQVEDNLDNFFIYDVLVKRIAKMKGLRQLIIVTHNPNPPALAGAERIFSLVTDDDGCGFLAAWGQFDEVLEHVERTEGGREAFRLRAERYGVVPAAKKGEDEGDDS